jgi:hypothetical protein
MSDARELTEKIQHDDPVLIVFVVASLAPPTGRTPIPLSPSPLAISVSDSLNFHSHSPLPLHFTSGGQHFVGGE